MASITSWTRLEPFARREDVDRGLQATVHDALWLLARQWQNGEFQGEDGGTPVQARIRVARLPITGSTPVRSSGRRFPLDGRTDRTSPWKHSSSGNPHSAPPTRGTTGASPPRRA